MYFKCKKSLFLEFIIFFGGGNIMEYKEKIIEMVEKINNQEFLKKIYYFIRAFIEG